ncbi:MAG TPA: zf-HC2 domain-containing protein [Sphingobium sp.]|nr:zf-HC2 domain-containing protein [Sphingobium sp.]
MADIIAFCDDPHRGMEMLLPWYASGRLEPEDAVAVAAHLEGCDQCRAMLDRERRLKTEMARLPLRPDLGWEKLQRRLAPERRHRQGPSWKMVSWPVTLALGGAQMAMLAFALLLVRPAAPPVDYHTLGAPAARSGGNILLLFRPDVTQAEWRVILARAGVRLVDGPTAAGAYVADIDPARQATALRILRAEPGILLAQPITPGPPR